MTQLNPYLSFDGKAEEAFNFYSSVFKTEIRGILRWGDNPECEAFSDADKTRVMHAALPVGNGMLMGSDWVGFGPPFKAGNNFQIAISPTSRDEADRIYKELSDGGNATMPLAAAFWGGYFGMLSDKFGIQWMINFEDKAEPAA